MGQMNGIDADDSLIFRQPAQPHQAADHPAFLIPSILSIPVRISFIRVRPVDLPLIGCFGTDRQI
jgi:hypothetical protein